MSTTINTSDNNVSITQDTQTLTITNNNTGTAVSVKPTDPSTITIATPGPAGPTGPIGPAGSGSGVTSYSELSGIPSGIYSSSLQTLGNITSSSNISASGDITANNLYLDQYIYHADNLITYLNFTQNRLRFNIGGISYIDLNDETGPPRDITFNDGGNNVDLTIKGSSNNPLFKTDASLNRIGTHGKGSPEVAFHIGGDELRVDGNISASGTMTVGDNQKLFLNKTEDTYIQSMVGDIARVVAGGNQMLILDYDTGNRAVFGNGTKVYIGANNNAIPTNELEVEGNISSSATVTGQTGSFEYIKVNEYIAHNGDENTNIRFTSNKISLDAGGMTFFAVHDDDSAPFTATVNGGGNTINFRALDTSQRVLLKTDSQAFNVGLYYAGNEKLSTNTNGIHVTGNISGSASSTGSFSSLVVDGASVDFSGLPTSDPGVAGRLYNDSGTIKISL